MRLFSVSVMGMWLLVRAGSALALPPLSDKPPQRPATEPPAATAPPPAAEPSPAPAAAKPSAAAHRPSPAPAAVKPSAADQPAPAGLAPADADADREAVPAAPSGEAPAPGVGATGRGGREKYVGVVPGGESKNPLPRAGKAPPHLIWSGFQSGDNGSRVFFQTNMPVTFALGKPGAAHGGKPGTVSIFLRNCRIHLRNNSRHLDTRFFATPVEGVTAVQRRKDVELLISLKQPASPTPRTEPGPDGTQFLVLDFPPGQPLAEIGRASGQGAGADLER